MSIFAYFYWDPPREVFSWNIPFLQRPVYWYGVLFALGFIAAYSLAKRLIRTSKPSLEPVLDRLIIWIGIGSILGSRLFDVFFYQGISSYQENYLKVLYFWEGGLASHGGVLGAFLAILLFFKLSKKPLAWVFLDLAAVPAAVLACFIRLGNFFNQEVLGTFCTYPWAVSFGHPIDGQPLIPRHPVQLYESFFYLALAGGLFLAIKKKKFSFGEGRILGVLLFSIFTFRFFIEMLKEEQSALWSHSHLTMGQLLSIPILVCALFLSLRKRALPPLLQKSGRDSS